MNSRDKPPDNLDELRSIAEQKLRENGGPEPDTLSDMSPEQRHRIIHELRTHQIELELQNEELRRAQIELEVSRARYFDLYELAPVGYCTVSQKGLIIEANLTAAKLLNTARESVVKQPMSRFILRQDQDIFYLHRKRLFETGEPQVCELRMTGGNSPGLWVRIDASVSAENHTPVYRVVITDITKRKQAEKQLLELNENLEQKVKERTGLAEARARELRFLTVELIEAEEKERRRIAEVLHDDLQQMLASAKLHLQVACEDFSAQPALAKVDDLLRQSIKKSRNLSLELSPVAVYQSGLHKALKWLASRMKEQFGLDVHIEAADCSDVQDESVRVFFFRAIQELLFNAAKHSGAKSVLVKLSHSGGQMTITVSDQGRGFAPEILDSKGSGRGIGLLSLRERTKAMGGDLLVQSAPGKGSSFSVRIPYAAGSRGPDKPDKLNLNGNAKR
jgi:PAS domain S-box-containing protein